MIELVKEIVSYPFMVRAIIVGSLVAVCSALLGVSLVLKRYSMIGDGLSHVRFGALAIAASMNVAPLKVSIPVVVIAAFFLLRMSENSKLKGDAAIAMISTGSLAGGVMIISMTTGMNTDVCNYLFGSILGMTNSDLQLTIMLSIFVIATYIFMYNRIFSVTLDESFTNATGNKGQRYNTVIAILTAIIIVMGMRMMGAMLVSSLIVIPALSSMRIFKSFKTVIISSVFIALICLWIGIIISYVFATPTGASIVVCNLIVFFIYTIIGMTKGGRIIGK